MADPRNGPPVRPSGENGRFALTREHWVQSIGTIGILVLTGGGMLAGATLWIESTIRSVAETNLAALNAQAAIVAQTQASNEKRITTLEVQELATAHAIDELTLETSKLRDAEGDLSTAVQVLTRQLPERRR
jgi:hypothetical protein